MAASNSLLRMFVYSRSLFMMRLWSMCRASQVRTAKVVVSFVLSLAAIVDCRTTCEVGDASLSVGKQNSSDIGSLYLSR